MAVTRIKNNQITDATITAQKIANQTLVGSLFSPDLTLVSNLSIVGNLTVTGNTSNINAINTFVTDPFVIFNNGYNGSLANYTIGFLVNRNLASLAAYGAVNTAWVWSESDSAFVGMATTDTGSGITSINNSGYANVKVGNLEAVSSITATNYNISQANVIGAKVDTLVATNFSTGNSRITGGYADNYPIGANTAATGAFTTLSSTSTFISSGNMVAGSGTASSNTTTGALVVAGGAGVSGSLNIGANVTAGNVIAPAYYSTGGTTRFQLSDIGLVTVDVAGQQYKFGAGGIESSPGIFGGSFGGSKLSLNSETNLIANRLDVVKIQTGTDGSIQNEWTFSNNALTTPGGVTVNGILAANGGNIVTLRTANFSTANAVVTGGSINNTVIGNTTAAAGTFTTVTATTINAGTTTTATLNSTTGNITTLGAGTTTTATLNSTTGNITNGNSTTFVATNLSSSNAVVTGGSANSFKIGNATPESGAFTTLSSTGSTTFTNATQSDNATTGAVVVTGGVGIGANLNVAGNVTVLGNLLVQGNTTTLNVETLNVEDLNVTVAANATTGAEANGAGLTVAGANATLTYLSADDSWNLNKKLNATALRTSGNIVAASDTTSTTYTTGALVVPGNGGVGIGGNLNVRGTSDFTGNITAGNILVSGNINVTVGAVASSYGIFYGNAGGVGALYAGTTGYTPIDHTVLQMTADLNNYAQLNFQNINTGSSASADIVATANNGDDFFGYVNLGIASSNYNNPYQPDFFPNDSYLIAHGVGTSGNLIIISELPGTAIRFRIGDYDEGNAKATITSTGFRVNTSTTSTSTTSGALLVDGGAGIKGNIHAAAINATPIGNTTPSTGAFTTVTATDSSAVTLVTTNFSTSNARIASGYADSFPVGANTAASGAFTTLSASSTTISQGNIVAAATTSSTNTTTGALVVRGGAGIAGAVNIGTSLTVDGGSYGNVVTTQFGSVFAAASGPNPYSIMQVLSSDFTGMGMLALGRALYSSSDIVLRTGVTVRDKDYPTGGTNGVIIAANGAIINTTGITSTSTTSGALIISGGIGISGNLNVGQSAIFNTTKTANYDFIVRGDNDDTLIWARPSSTYDAVVIGNSATTGTLVNGAKLIVNTTDSIIIPVGTTAQRPGSTGGTDAAGMIRFNSSTDQLEYHDGTEWNNTGTTFTVIAADSFDGDDSATIFTLGAAATTNSCIVSINGVVQIPTTAYSVSGTTLTFTSPPATGDKIDVRRLTTTSTVTILQSQNGYVAADAQNDSLIISAGTSSLTERLRVHTNGNVNVSGNLVLGANIIAGGTNGTAGQFLSSTGTGLSWVSLSASSISNGTSNVTVASNGGITFGVGSANVIAVGSTAVVPNANVAINLGNTTNWFGTFYGVSTQAQYADLAENYQADQLYTAGTVLEFGGTEEVTVAMTEGSVRVAGIVSSNPAHLMNGGLRGSNVVALALVGRVPCNVIGPVHKGDMMVSAGYGYAKASSTPVTGSVIGKALQNFEGDKGVIEVVVGRV